MSDTNTDPIESKTRANLAYLLISGGLIFIGYIIYRWGDQKEILTLIIGLISGALIGAPISVYFAGGLAKKAPETSVQGNNNTVTSEPKNEV